MYVYMWMSVHVFVYMCVHIYVYVCICMSVLRDGVVVMAEESKICSVRRNLPLPCFPHAIFLTLLIPMLNLVVN